jgi:transcriptional regulator with XRE-family HTH domain
MTVKQSADKSAAKKPRARSAPVADRGSRAVVSAIGSEVRRLRKRLELTANELARRAGLSVAMLSRIETGHAAPSLPSLAAIAGGLGVPMARLFATHDKVRDCCFVPAGQGLRVERRGSRFGHLYNILGKSLSGPAFMEPYLITLDGASQMNTGFQHEGTELLYVLSGSMRYRYQDLSYILKPGDSLMFDANGIHGPEELLSVRVTCLSVTVHTRG